MKKNLLPLLALAASAFAADQESPQQIVQKIYDAHLQPGGAESAGEFADYAGAEIKALLAKDDQLADGEIACINYDYIIQAQDYDAEEIKRSLKIKTLDNHRVEATFQNFGTAAAVIYQFACTDKQCRITDLLEEDRETHKFTSFKTSLAACLAETEKSAGGK